MLNELKRLVEAVHEKLDQLLTRTEPAVQHDVQLAEGEVEKIANAVMAKLAGPTHVEVQTPQDAQPAEAPADPNAQQ